MDGKTARQLQNQIRQHLADIEARQYQPEAEGLRRYFVRRLRLRLAEIERAAAA